MKKRSAILLALLLSTSMVSPSLTYMQVYAEDNMNHVIVESENPTGISEADNVETQPEQSNETEISGADTDNAGQTTEEGQLEDNACNNEMESTTEVTEPTESEGTAETIQSEEIANADIVNTESLNSNTEEKPVEKTAPSVTGTKVQVVKSDGTEFKMFVISESEVSASGDKLKITMSTNNVSFDGLYFGSKEDTDKSPVVEGTQNASGGWDFTFEVAASNKGTCIPVVLRKKKDGSWYTSADLWMYIPSEVTTPDPEPTPMPEPTPDPKPNPGEETKVLEDGIYEVNVTSSAAMFRVTNCTLTVKDGKIDALLTLSGKGYGYLYPGTAEKAAEDESNWVPFVTNENGEYTYTIPVEALDKEIAVVAYSTENKKWYDRTLVFESESLKKVGDIENGGGDDPSTPSKPSEPTIPTTPTIPNVPTLPGTSGNDGKADNESKYESDTSGSTAKVESATTLADGVYTPDRFSWSGGTGKVQITCNKITIQNGQAYATLVFSSDHYQYVKASGNTYYTTKGGGTATVVIPVALNQNNRIIAMTDKMSTAHEIEYHIFIYLAAANGGNSTKSNLIGSGNSDNQILDEKAPEIMGLEYQSETKLEYAQYFKIYHYEKGIVLLEVDMTKDTARDPEVQKKDSDSKDTADKSENKTTDTKTEQTKDSAAESLEQNGKNGVSEKELAAELYKGNVVKYLIVPENVNIPVGLDQDMIIVNVPADKTYAASDDILKTMEQLNALDSVAAVGSKQKDCTISAIADKMKKGKDGKSAEVVYGGNAENPKYKTLVKQKVNLVLLPESILPKEEKSEQKKETTSKENKSTDTKSTALTVEEQTERFEEYTEKFAMLGIPVIVDRSADEQTELAKQEWLKVYGVLYGCEDEANQLFEKQVENAEK